MKTTSTTSGPHAAALLAEILSENEIDSLRPAINCFFYAPTPTSGAGLERFDKYTVILAQIRAVAQAAHLRLDNKLPIPLQDVTGADAAFFAQLAATAPDDASVTHITTLHEDPVIQPDAEDLLSIARNACANHDPWRAIGLLSMAPPSMTKSLDFASCYATASVALNRGSAALWALEQVVPATEDEAALLAYELGIVWYRHLPVQWRDREKAVSLFSQAVEAAQDGACAPQTRAVALNALALTLTASNPMQAIVLEREALSVIHQKDAGTVEPGMIGEDILRNNLAVLLRQTGDLEQSLREAERAIQVGGSHPAYIDSAWRALLAMSREDEAEYYAGILRSMPNDLSATLSAANYAGAIRDHSTAIEHYRRALGLSPAALDIRLALAEHLLELGQIEEADATLANIDTTRLPPDALPRLALARLQIESSAWPKDEALPKVIDNLQALLEEFPEDRAIAANLHAFKERLNTQ